MSNCDTSVDVQIQLTRIVVGASERSKCAQVWDIVCEESGVYREDPSHPI